jgi:DNA polymerase/3'-5' exonuclease PolX
MNVNLVQQLTQLSKIYEYLDEYRSRAYTLAAKELSNLDYEITKDNLPNLKERKIPHIGKKILELITEYANTGQIKELTSNTNDKIKSIEELSKISGVGPAAVSSFLRLGINNLADLRRAIARGTVSLNHHQQLGLLYYNDLNERIPRSEVTDIVRKLQHCITIGSRSNSRSNNQIIFTVAGSYRRQALTCGDIDILITSVTPINNYLAQINRCLRDDPGFIDNISAGDTRLSFLYRLDKCRQVDLLYLPYRSYYAALNYFTGSDNFNKKIRGIAKSQGYLLNQNGLYRGSKIIPLNNEEELFKILGEQYVEPKMRV